MALEVRVTRNMPEAGERNGDAEYRTKLRLQWSTARHRRMKPADVQADTGCRAAAVQADIGYRPGVMPVVTQADTGCRAGGDAGRHGLSCRW